MPYSQILLRKQPVRTRILVCALASLIGLSPVPIRAEGDNPILGDYFDGLRAWDLHEEATAAVIWLSAAQFGDNRAMEKVAALYAEGTVFPKDQALAYFWYSLAGIRGSSSATSTAAMIRPLLNQTDIDTVDASVRAWQPKLLSLPPSKSPDLFTALNERDINGFKAAFVAGASAQSKDPNGMPILILAIATKDRAFIDEVLSHGPDVNTTLPNGLTALHVATGMNEPAIVEMLMANGALTVIQDKNGVSPLDIAERMRLTNLVDRLQSQTQSDAYVINLELKRRGYIDSAKIFDRSAFTNALRMFQTAHHDSPISGFLDLNTYQQVLSDAHGDNSYSYMLVYTYNNRSQYFYGTGSVFAPSAQQASNLGLQQCISSAETEHPPGKNCIMNVLPKGGCISVARPSGGGAFVISSPMPSGADADSDALAQCKAKNPTGCSIDKRVCNQF